MDPELGFGHPNRTFQQRRNCLEWFTCPSKLFSTERWQSPRSYILHVALSLSWTRLWKLRQSISPSTWCWEGCCKLRVWFRMRYRKISWAPWCVQFNWRINRPVLEHKKKYHRGLYMFHIPLHPNHKMVGWLYMWSVHPWYPVTSQYILIKCLAKFISPKKNRWSIAIRIPREL